MALSDYIPFMKKDGKKKEEEPTDLAGTLLKYRDGLKKANDVINPPKDQKKKTE